MPRPLRPTLPLPTVEADAAACPLLCRRHRALLYRRRALVPATTASIPSPPPAAQARPHEPSSSSRSLILSPSRALRLPPTPCTAPFVAPPWMRPLLRRLVMCGSICGAASRHHGRRSTSRADFLPSDIWRHIHSLIPLRDAAQAACVSQSFMFSWKCYPNLILKKKTLGLDEFALEKETTREFRSKIDHILTNYSYTAMRKLNLWLVPNYNTEDCYYIHRWLQKAVTPRIE